MRENFLCEVELGVLPKQIHPGNIQRFLLGTKANSRKSSVTELTITLPLFVSSYQIELEAFVFQLGNLRGNCQQIRGYHFGRP